MQFDIQFFGHCDIPVSPPMQKVIDLKQKPCGEIAVATLKETKKDGAIPITQPIFICQYHLNVIMRGLQSIKPMVEN